MVPAMTIDYSHERQSSLVRVKQRYSPKDRSKERERLEIIKNTNNNKVVAIICRWCTREREKREQAIEHDKKCVSVDICFVCRVLEIFNEEEACVLCSPLT
jgi:hypothetical protein